MSYIQNLKSALPLGGHRLALTFDDGFTAELDLLPALTGGIFEPLKSAAFFCQVEVEDGAPTWPNGADIDPGTLRIWAKAGRILSLEETNSHAARNRSMAGAA